MLSWEGLEIETSLKINQSTRRSISSVLGKPARDEVGKAGVEEQVFGRLPADSNFDLLADMATARSTLISSQSPDPGIGFAI